MWRRRATFGFLALLFFISAVTLPVSAASAQGSPTTVTDGPAPCSAGNPPNPLHGMCATYNGANTFYGIYGPGFPTALGWGICAWSPATGGWYPSPSYGYVLSDAPQGIDSGNLAAFGFALSELSSSGFFQGSASWSADDAAVAAKLVYDEYAWHTPLPLVSTGIQQAIDALHLWTYVYGVTGGSPQVSASLPGGASEFTSHTTVTISVRWPDGAPQSNIALTLSLTGAVFSQNQAPTLSVVTNTAGQASVDISATSQSASLVTLTSAMTMGLPGLSFYRPSQAFAQNAQLIFSPFAAQVQTATSTWSSLEPPPPMGQISVEKSGNDEPYLGVANATFEILSGSTVLDTLVTGDQGMTESSVPLPVGTYTLHEAVAPPGYQPVADRSVSVTADQTTVVSLTGGSGDLVEPATLSLEKVDDLSGAPLAGAVLAVAWDAQGTGNYVRLGTCTTDTSGLCVPPGNDGSSLLPGYYQVNELSAPQGYLVNPETAVDNIELAPGQSATVRFADDRALTSLSVEKTNVAEPGQGVPDATYDLYVQGTPPLSAPASTPLATQLHSNLTWYASGVTDAGGHLTFTIPVGFSWCVQERSAPPDYIVDPALRCTGVITAASPDPVRTVAVSEQVATVTLSAFKFNAARPGLGIPDATYALYVEGAFPPGFLPPSPPSGLVVPAGLSLWSVATTNAAGQLTFTLPSGHQWCLQELVVPANYLLDTGLHCTGVLSVSGQPSDDVALPELAATGNNGVTLLAWGTFLLVAGLVVLRRSAKSVHVSRSGMISDVSGVRTTRSVL